jgi:hypothetical protein
MATRPPPTTAAIVVADLIFGLAEFCEDNGRILAGASAREADENDPSLSVCRYV